MSLQVSQANYASILLNAQKAFDDNLAPLKTAAADNATEGSIAHQIDGLDKKTKEMKETPRAAENYATLKAQFIQFMNAQLGKYETAKKTKEGGLAAIATITSAKATCVTSYPKPEEILAAKKIMVMIGSKESKIDEALKSNEEAIAAYKFDAQLQELTPLVKTVTDQISVLEWSLDKAFYAKKEAEGKTGILDRLTPTHTFSFLSAAIAEKNKPAPVVVEKEQKQELDKVSA